MSHKRFFSLSIATLQINMNQLNLFEHYSMSRLTFAIDCPLLTSEMIISPYRRNTTIPVPNNYNRNIIPDSLSVVVCIGVKAANASKNATLMFMKLYECRTRALVYQNIQQYRSLEQGMMGFTKLLVATHEDTILSAINPGSRIIGLVGCVLLFSPTRGYFEGPPGYGREGQNPPSGFSGNPRPPYPFGPLQNPPEYADHNLYPPYFTTSNSNFRPLDPPPLDYVQAQTYPSYPPPGFVRDPPSNFQTNPQNPTDYQITHFPYPNISNANLPPIDALLEF